MPIADPNIALGVTQVLAVLLLATAFTRSRHGHLARSRYGVARVAAVVTVAGQLLAITCIFLLLTSVLLGGMPGIIQLAYPAIPIATIALAASLVVDVLDHALHDARGIKNKSSQEQNDDGRNPTSNETLHK